MTEEKDPVPLEDNPIVFRNTHKFTGSKQTIIIEFGFYMDKRPVFEDQVELFLKGEDPVTMYEKLSDFMASLAFCYQVVESDEVRALKTYKAKMNRIKMFFNEQREEEISTPSC